MRSACEESCWDRRIHSAPEGGPPLSPPSHLTSIIRPSPVSTTMKLFGWLKRDPASKGYVPARAVVIPHYPRSEAIWGSVESTFNANSTTTMSVTVRALKDGESPEEIGAQYPRLPPKQMHATTPTPEGCYRLH